MWGRGVRARVLGSLEEPLEQMLPLVFSWSHCMPLPHSSSTSNPPPPRLLLVPGFGSPRELGAPPGASLCPGPSPGTQAPLRAPQATLGGEPGDFLPKGGGCCTSLFRVEKGRKGLVSFFSSQVLVGRSPSPCEGSRDFWVWACALGTRRLRAK